MKNWFNIFWVFLLFSACKKDDINIESPSTPLEISIDAMANHRLVKTGEIYQHLSLLDYKVSELKFYISNIRFINQEGQEFPFSISKNIPGHEQGVFLYWLGKNEITSGNIDAQEYKQIKFDLGLSPTLNDLNPNQFSSTHPLSRDTDMFWDMLKYRFLIFEGKLDKDNDSSYSLPYSYHLGGDEFLRTVTLNIDLDLRDKNLKKLPIQFNLDKLYTDGTDTIDILNFFSYHSINEQKEIGLKMMDFSANAFE
ncbi:MAG: hypothetical protein M9958_05215 [Chitinophagales bacterium]|nr:hypothetical protein [Chitinophagales bacterium]